MIKGKVSVFWFRRDLRLEDNTALIRALETGYPVLPVFIFDIQIIDELAVDDPRVFFIYGQLQQINQKLAQRNSSLSVLRGDPLAVWKELSDSYDIHAVYANKDYEPYANSRDREIGDLLACRSIPFHRFKDQVIFEEHEIVKKDGKPYTVFTPYKRKWLEKFRGGSFLPPAGEASGAFLRISADFPRLEALGFKPSQLKVLPYDLSRLKDYPHLRDLPGPDATTYLSPHLRFGTVSIRKIVGSLGPSDEIFLSELIWREFFMQILFHFPQVVSQNFHPKYNGITWNTNPDDFERWCRGETGYPMVDAGMRQLNATGYMHNRVRMVTAGFLCKHLLTDWRLGEAYFAEQLLDYELSSNNGNWQWAAGTGCDAAPYFRVFNPTEQVKKFDRDLEYIRQWIPEFGTSAYPEPMIDHRFARERALEAYRKGIENYLPES
ncbi:MAG: deoxyribodipyrimidine photo-lyase [Bacteroidales bacterium]|nr:deoxyribodipyrimidine photo-lyase [Bacteroidales bacterium]